MPAPEFSVIALEEFYFFGFSFIFICDAASCKEQDSLSHVGGPTYICHNSYYFFF